MLPLLLLVLVPGSSTHQAARPARRERPTLALAIIPARYASAQGEACLVFSEGERFHVLLTNQSAQPVTLFQEWNSWGYFGLSFDMTYADGRRVRVEKESRPWRGNYPSTFTLPPQGSYVFDVTLGPKEWTNSPRPAPRLAQGLACRLRARYAIEPSPEAKGMWTGTVVSAENAYVLWP
ncbi:MAG: hypothetical protein EOO59_14355 [Hymenobacter sp.]|nr:MAG: hypothetical protein EOO59_14355 [Hymenobacter sp.]